MAVEGAIDFDQVQADDETDLISPRAEIFRSKLIADFNLLDRIEESGHKLPEAPKFHSSEFQDEERGLEILEKNQFSLVQLDVRTYKSGAFDVNERRQNRVRNKTSKNPSLDIWAHWIVESSFFQNFILVLILVNSIVLGVQGELSAYESETIEKVKLALNILDYCSMFMYMMEIFLKWIDSFWGFWHNRWNIFDFCVTFLFFIPEIINFASGEFGKKQSSSAITVIANNLRTFRILRSLKMVSRFQKVRLIVLAVTKAFQAMIFITVLLLLFAYIFAIIGVMFFKDGYRKALDTEVAQDLHYTDSFTSIGTALITLFQLFTLDHWFDVYKDVTKVSNELFGSVYVILWIIIGSFIFRNIFAGIMVNNFQNIRKDLFHEVEEIIEQENHQNAMLEFAVDLDRHKASMTRLHKTSSQTNSHDLGEEGEDIEKEQRDWEEVVTRHVQALSKDDTNFCWPRDTLFQYFLVMEAMQENLRERQELMALLTESLLNMMDT